MNEPMKRLRDFISPVYIREMRERILARQDGLCAICGRDASAIQPEQGDLKRLWQLDHCHKSGRLRGVLCSYCNRGIGQFEDNPARLLSAIYYLLLHGVKGALYDHLSEDAKKLAAVELIPDPFKK